jgi:NADH dehydrogenase (ubiquinone) flavoprotein 1/RNA-binding protein Musashi
MLECSGRDGATRLVQQANPGAPVFLCAGRPRGFGFVVFESPEVVKKVIESKHTIDKRDVECKIAVPKEEVPTPASGADASAKTRKIFVGGLAPTVDDQVRF